MLQAVDLNFPSFLFNRSNDRAVEVIYKCFKKTNCFSVVMF